MLQLGFPFAPDEDERVIVEWESGFRNVAVRVDGRVLGEVSKLDTREVEFPLSDGTKLELRTGQFPFAELRISRNGLALPNSAGDPAQQVKRAAKLACILGVFGVALGLLTSALQIGVLASLGVGFASAVGAGLLALLGFAGMHGFPLALVGAVALYLADTVYLLTQLTPGSIGAPVARIIFLIPMLRALPAIITLMREPPVHRRGPARAAVKADESGANPVRTRLSDQAEVRRQEITAKISAARSATSAEPSTRSASRDVLRFAAPKCELSSLGLRVVSLDGTVKEVSWVEIAGLFARRLPPEPPLDGKVLIDVVLRSGLPIRIAPSTMMNFALLPGQAAPSRLENLRRMLQHIAEHCPHLSVDPGTRTFMESQQAPPAFRSLNEFAEYDASYS
ncbi:MAG TPA: hypothetical protein VHO25_07635 [Polyangiaceae bacterium]|nr:hypothetical protein [Polyangiaceae bacterium]